MGSKYIFVWEQVKLVHWIVNTLCHMVFHYQTHLASIMAMLVMTHVIFHVGFSTKGCHRFGMPQTWEVNIYICVGTS